MKSFYFHFNKPKTLSTGSVKITVHHNNRCQLVNNVVCNVPTIGRIKSTQPKFVMAGKCNSFEIIEGVGYIN